MSDLVAAVVVAHSSNAVLPACLDSLRRQVGETVVVDNCPDEPVPPDLQAQYPWVRWIDGASDPSFAAGANRGVAATRAPLVLFLNPDCQLLTDLDAMVTASLRKGAAGAGGLLIGPDAAPQTGFMARSFPTPWALALEALGLNRIWDDNPVNRRYRLLDLDPEFECFVDQPAGAFLMVRREALDAVGGFDEAFRPVWFEDVDLCRRLADAGGSFRYTPRSAAGHDGAHSVGRLPLHQRLEAWYGGLLRYADKHFSHSAYRGVRFAVLVGLLFRAAWCTAGGGSSAAAAAHSRLFRLVRRGFPHGSPAS